MRTVLRELLFDDDGAAALATAAGAHGVYVRNALAAQEGDGFVVARGGRDAGVVWLGPRGNLVVVADGDRLDELATRIADEVARRHRPWRIAMGPVAIVDHLRERLPVKPLACRDQVYYVGDRTTAAAAHVRDDVRLPQRADRDRLVQATLALNASDLNVDPARVDRRWLRDTIDERIAAGTTRVIGPVGALRCKLDFGSSGPGGTVIEGVFTFPDARGLGFATGLVATCLAQAEGDVCLHVGAHNKPARAAYEAAGMHAGGSCRLLLLP
jgi:GNAT superfamily N-acetyltransferase